jgi:hypothetical protein
MFATCLKRIDYALLCFCARAILLCCHPWKVKLGAFQRSASGFKLRARSKRTTRKESKEQLLYV